MSAEDRNDELKNGSWGAECRQLGYDVTWSDEVRLYEVRKVGAAPCSKPEAALRGVKDATAWVRGMAGPKMAHRPVVSKDWASRWKYLPGDAYGEGPARIGGVGYTLVATRGPVGTHIVSLHIAPVRYAVSPDSRVTFSEDITLRAVGFGGEGQDDHESVAGALLDHAVELGFIDLER